MGITLTKRASQTNRAAGLNMWNYGDSLSIDPPVAGTYGRPWMNLVRQTLDLDRFTTAAIGGSDAIGVAYHVINGSTAGTGLPAAAPGAKWDPNRRGFIVLSVGVNDATMTRDRYTNGKINVSPFGPDAISGLQGAFRAILAAASSASRIEIENAAVTGTWTTVNGAQYSNGSSKYTQRPGDHADFANVTFPASGKVHLIMASLDPLSFAIPDRVDISVDGAVVKQVTAATLTMRPQKTGASASITSAPCAIEVDATPGPHTVTVTHAGSGTLQVMSIDCLLIPAASPPPIFHLREFDPPVAAYASQAEHDQVITNRGQLEPAYAAVVAEFANASQIQLVVDPGGFSTADNLHPNERGAVQMAATISDAIRARLATFTPDNLFFSLGNILSPQISQSIATGVWPATSGTDVKVTVKSMICISGGTVTAISIDGVATGLTSGTFIVRAGHRISVTYSVVPNYSNWDPS